MIQSNSIVKVVDNTGGKTAKVIGIPGGTKRRFVTLADTITVAVQDALPKGVVKAHEVCKAVVVRTKKEYKRKDGSYIRFDDNAVVLLDTANKKAPKGTRVLGPIARELKDSGFDKIISLAPEVL